MDTPDDLFPDNLERLTLLERAQQLHDVTLRRHAESLRRHEVWHQEHLERMARLEDLIARQQQLQQAILDYLRRDNGR
jgi:hypothetical protein